MYKVIEVIRHIFQFFSPNGGLQVFAHFLVFQRQILPRGGGGGRLFRLVAQRQNMSKCFFAQYPKDIILWVKRCHFVGLTRSFAGLKTSFYGPLGCKIFGNKRRHSVGLLNSSFSGSKDVILRI